MRFRLIYFVLFLFAGFSALATHNRAGEITYKRISPFSTVVGGVTVPVFTYSITVIKYTADGQFIADRCADTIYFGDGQREVIPRLNGPTGICDCPNMGGKPVGCGSIIINDPNYRVKQNIYTVIHTYPGAGTYMIRSIDPNRNADVHNMSQSVNQPFYIESLLIIDNFTGANSSPVFAFAPIDKACMGICFEHNPGAYDPDGDSLSYEITTSRGLNGQTVPGYFYPETGANGSFGIDAVTGLLKWCTPQLQAEFNIAFIVKEWRKNTSNEYKLIGYVLRDMQVIVNNCPINVPPVVSPIEEICVEAGTTIQKIITVSDQNPKSVVTIAGGGGAFSGAIPRATLTPTTDTVRGPSNSYQATLKWVTNCDHARNQTYLSTIKATDNGFGSEIKLVTFQTFVIRVYPPSIKGLSATPSGVAMTVTWQPAICNPATNKLVRYKVYRKNDCVQFTPTPCTTGLDPSSGFVQIGTVTPTQSTFIDDNNDDGLVVGENYSYLVVAEYDDGMQSFAGVPVCSKLKRDVPVITNVSVLSTAATGSVEIKWLRPLTTPGNLDLAAFPGPYTFNLMHRQKAGDSFTKVFTSSSPTFTDLAINFVHGGIRTDSAVHEYYIDFISGTNTVGSSQRATSVFLLGEPNDRRIDLRWLVKTPWSNYSYSVYRRDPDSLQYRFLAKTTETVYADQKNIENGKTYCYYVQSEGKYSDTSILKPLINNSQEICVKAVDRTPPISPTISINADCPSALVEVAWTDIRPYSDDVSFYQLFYKPTITAEYALIATVKADQPLVFKSDNPNTFAGCYAVKATDINGNVGKMAEDFCVDICPEFELPNVFSPNGDNANDHFKAVVVRQIKQIDLNIVDRWGNLVYHTTDPYFEWNGINQVNGQPLSAGTFFFVCDVFEPRLKGTVKRNIHGYVELVR